MPENKQGTWIYAAVIALVIGFLIGLIAFNGSGYDKGYTAGKDSVVIPTCEANFKTCEAFCVPVNAQSCGVLGLVAPITCNETIETDYLGTATDDFMDRVDHRDELQTCNGTEYDRDQIAIKTIYDSYSVEYDEDEYTVNFEVKLKYLDKDTEEKCYNTFDVSVFYEPNEKPVVSY